MIKAADPSDNRLHPRCLRQEDDIVLFRKRLKQNLSQARYVV